MCGESTNATPAGNAPVADSVGVGRPVAVAVKVPEVPTANVVAPPLVMLGASVVWLTVRVKDWEAFEPTPLEAAIVMG